MPPVGVVLPNVSTSVQDGVLEIDFLLPTGIMVPMRVNFHSTLDRLKEDLWREAKNLPLKHLLKENDVYCFVCINMLGVKEELLDESQSLDDIRPFSPFLKLVEKQGDEPSKTLSRNINSLVGKGPQKMEAWSPAEVSEFRQKMVQECEKIILSTEQSGWVEKLKLNHPPILRNICELPPRIRDNLGRNEFIFDVKIKATMNTTKTVYKMNEPAMGKPLDLITAVLNKWSRSTGHPVRPADSYLLKVAGRDEYIYGDHPLQQFKYVYQCLTKNTSPELLLIDRAEVVDAAPAVPPRHDRRPSIAPADKPGPCVWDIDQKYYVTIKGINKIQLLDNIKVQLFVGLYHGSEPLCELCDTGVVPVLSSRCNMTIDLKFDIAVADLPNASRICFALYAFSRKSGKEKTPVAWLNIPVFDFRLRLIRGERETDMWSVKDVLVFEETCNVLGTVSPNPYGHDSATLSVSFPDYNIQADILYPSYEKVIEFGKRNGESSSDIKVSKSHIDQLKMILNRDPMTQLFEQDKHLLWLLRQKCHNQYPNALPKLLNSVKWNKHEDTAKMTVLLQTWPLLPVDYALELLDFNFPDKDVREFAIRSLDDKLSDGEMSMYLLQLVQAVKYENYLNCPLVKFLLTRAVKNQHMGQQLFWHLKSEMHDPSVMVRFRLILDVYLRSRKNHLPILMKQSESLGKLKALNEIVKNPKYNFSDQKSRDKAKADMSEILEQKSYQTYLTKLVSHLSPVYKLKDLLVKECRIMNSKKRPLLLVWSNNDAETDNNNNINLIFKDGDDLRQDMLTLQMFRIMDAIWLEEGLDFRMNPYCVLATGREQGIIEVVTKSETIASIQKEFNKGAFDKRALFEWLKKYNDTDEKLDDAVDEFIASCAGYCVATYVLGIGDRHNDNIMLKQSGQLFHIDFGHFLGNFKSKFGIRRDRVPFVLTTHFVHVIKRGDAANGNFDKFRKYCEQAYIILRRKSHLLFSLFMMMLSSGIPQLTCTRDVNYLKETLVPQLSEEEARAHFKGKFQEAIRNSWTSNVQFLIHMKAN